MIIQYLLLINAIGFVIMLIDKEKAKRAKWRISEKALLTIACIGGCYGMFLAMHLFRHKTRHLKFTLGMPILMVVYTLLLIWYYT